MPRYSDRAELEDGAEVQSDLGFLTAFQWIPQGFINPTKVSQLQTSRELTQRKLGRRLGLSDAETQQLSADAAENELSSLHQQEDGSGGAGAGGDDDDPVFNAGGADTVLQVIESDDESDIDDTTIRRTDLVFVVSRAGEDPSIEVNIYDEPRDNIYAHHDNSLVAPPVCLEWLFNAEGKTSLAAVGTMHPYIEIWNLDMIDAVDPAAVLGGCINPEENYSKSHFRRTAGASSASAAASTGRSKYGSLREDSHLDAVTSLRWNANAPTIMASGGADSFVKVWDLPALTCLGTTKHPTGERVQSLDWCPGDANLLLCGCGGALDVMDCRTPDTPVVSWCCPEGDAVEKAAFTPADSSYVFGSTLQGTLACFDRRKGSKSDPLWAVTGLHGGETTFAISKHSPLIATGGAHDGIALWDLSVGGPSVAPTRLSQRKLRVGQCFSLQFHPNSPDVLGACGSAGLPLVYTITNDVGMGRAQAASAAAGGGGGGGQQPLPGEDDNEQQQQRPKRKKRVTK